MAHFAQLDENNTVIQVIVVANQDTSDVNGVESEEIGISFCKRLYGLDTKWKQTSYNNNIRVRYAGIGYTYNEALDVFIAPKRYPSWVFDEASTSWIAPIPEPTLSDEQKMNGVFPIWGEDTLSWKLIDPSA